MICALNEKWDLCGINSLRLVCSFLSDISVFCDLLTQQLVTLPRQFSILIEDAWTSWRLWSASTHALSSFYWGYQPNSPFPYPGFSLPIQAIHGHQAAKVANLDCQYRPRGLFAVISPLLSRPSSLRLFLGCPCILWSSFHSLSTTSDYLP